LIFIKKITGDENPKWHYGFIFEVPEKTPSLRTRYYCWIPFNIAFRLVYIIFCWVREPFPSYKRSLNEAIAIADERDKRLTKREETLRVLTYYIKEQGERLESRAIGTRRCINSVIKFTLKTIKEEEPKIYNELYPPKVSDKS